MFLSCPPEVDSLAKPLVWTSVEKIDNILPLQKCHTQDIYYMLRE